MNADEDVVSSLRKDLTGVAPTLTGKPCEAVTEALTAAAEACLRRQGYEVTREWVVTAPWGRGRVDLAGLPIGGKGRGVAIELDRSNKRRSVVKLSGVARAGQLAIWIRWGYRLPSTRGETVPSGITVIEVPLRFSRIPLSSSSPWWHPDD